MGNTFGSKPTETKKRPHSKTCDDQESLSGEDDHPRTLSAEGRRIASGGDMSAEQLTAAGEYLWELLHSNNPERDYSSNRVLARREVFAVKPPRSLTYTEPQLDTLHAICALEWGSSPPDHATVRTFGPVERRALWRLSSREWSWYGGGCYDGAAQSLQVFRSFKDTAFKMNGGEKPDEAFFLKHFKVPKKTYEKYTRPRRVWYVQLNTLRWPSRDYDWVETNKEWLTEHGAFSAWEKHCEALGGVPHFGWVGEPKMTDHHHDRLRGTYFVDEWGEEWRVLKVAWDDEGECNYVYYYDPALGDPPPHRQHGRRPDGSRWPTTKDCQYSTVDQVDAWIAARHKPKKLARTT